MTLENINIQRKLTYDIFFDDYSEVDVNDLIQGISTKDLLQFIGKPILQLHKFGFDQDKQVEYLTLWSKGSPDEVLKKIDLFFKEYHTQSNVYIDFIDNYSLLKFIEIILINKNTLPSKDMFTSNEHFMVFKAYLYCVQKWMNMQKYDLNIKIDSVLDPEFFIKINIPFEEYLFLKEARTQIIKAKIFYQFCEKNENFSGYLNKFIEHYKLSNWDTYINKFFSMYYAFIINQNVNIVAFSSKDSGDDLKNILDAICINEIDVESKDDFLDIRQYPIYKKSYDNYIILNMSFFIDKIYQGIQFDFFKLISDNKLLYNGKIIKNFAQFFGIYGFEFADKTLFFKVIEKTFEKLRFRKISGNEFMFDGAPDYYIRDNNDIFLFEFKNSYLKSKAKNSFNFSIIEEEIRKKFVSGKGVSQIASVIERIKSGQFDKIDKLKHHKLTIYPILVYIDYALNTAGINKYLNSEFLKIVSEKQLDKHYKVKNLVCIHLDELILLQDIFNKKMMRFKDCINGYYAFLNSRDDGEFQSFDRYVNSLMAKNILDFPKEFKDMVKEIHNKESI